MPLRPGAARSRAARPRAPAPGGQRDRPVGPGAAVSGARFLTAEDASPEPSAAELRAAQRLGRIGSWHWNSLADATTWSHELHRIFGHDPALPPPSFALHPQLYAPQSWSALQAAVARALAGGGPYCLELAYFCVDGEPGGWLEARGEAIRDAAGAVVGLRGTAQEISERRRAQEARAEDQARADRALMLRTFSQGIRTSLNAVFGFAHLLKKQAEPGGAQERWVDQILGASQQIVGLLQEMESLDAAFFAGAGERPAGAEGAASAEAVDRLERLMAMIPCPILIHDAAGRILHVSQALIESTGYSRAEIPTRTEWAALAYRGDDAREIAERLAAVRASRSVGDGGERWVTTKSGARRRWRLFATPIGSGAGEPLVVSIGIDVTAATAAAAAEPALQR